MPWSIGAAEAAGGIAGVTAERAAGQAAKIFCESADMPKPVTALVQAAAAGLVVNWVKSARFLR